MRVLYTKENYLVREMELRTDEQHFSLRGRCFDGVSGYLLCFCKSPNPPLREIAAFTEEVFRTIPERAARDFGGFRLQYVSRNLFEANPYFRLLAARPPEYIWLWAVCENVFGDQHTLYVPEDAGAQREEAPLRFVAEVRTENGLHFLKVSLTGPGEYTDGALLYQVGTSLPIPIPREYVGREIPILVPENEELMVLRG